MDIKAAAEFLGVSVKSVERLVKSKKIAVTYVEGKRDFCEVELTRFKEQKQQPIYRPALSQPNLDIARTQNDIALSQPVAPEYLGEGLGYIEVLAQSVAGIAHSVESTAHYHRLSAIRFKMLINLSEAEAISGLSKNLLSFHLKSGELLGQKLGRGWKIRPSDLEIFVDRLFSQVN